MVKKATPSARLLKVETSGPTLKSLIQLRMACSVDLELNTLDYCIVQIIINFSRLYNLNELTHRPKLNEFIQYSVLMEAINKFYAARALDDGCWSRGAPDDVLL